MDWHHFVILLWLLDVFSMVSCQVRNIILELNEEGLVKSPGFPLTCCSPESVAVHVGKSSNLGYLRMTFSDLDLPEGSRLEIFDGTVPNRSILFPEQPELIDGVWTRPALGSSQPVSGILIRFLPSNTSSSSHVGYKIHVWVTNSPPDRWHEKPITDQCMSVTSPLSGDRITQKALGPGSNSDQVIDCVWQIKVPSLADDDIIKPEHLRVFARITRLSFTGYLDVHHGVSSEGKPLLTLSPARAVSMVNLSMPSEGFTSRDGLYIHLSMLNKDRGLLQFIIGIFHSQKNLLQMEDDPQTIDPHLCNFGGFGQGFLCLNETWCIPVKHRCNHANNCASEEDEQNCKEQTMTERTTAIMTVKPASTLEPLSLNSTLPALPAQSCEKDYRMCRNGICEFKFSQCSGSGGPMCSSLIQIYCPHVGKCINRFRYPCSGYCTKCEDGSCSRDGKCPGICPNFYKRCPEGCLPSYKKCAGDCESWEKKCRDGSCIRKRYLCSGESCPSAKRMRCFNNKECYATHDKCDSMSDCADGSDEWDCPDTSQTSDASDSGLWLMILIPAILLTMCMVLVCKKGKNKSRSQSELDSQDGEIPIGPGQVRSGIDSYSGTRMIPLAPLNNYNQEMGEEEPMAGVPDPSAPPPSYDEVVSGGKDGMPPPYYSA